MDATYWWNGSLVSGAVEYRLAQFGQEFINRHLYLSDLLFLFFWKRTRRKPGKFSGGSGSSASVGLAVRTESERRVGFYFFVGG